MPLRCSKCHTENPETQRFCGGCGTPLPPSGPSSPSQLGSILITETLETAAQELTTGSLFAGRYQIIEELGHGGMGRVYRALDKKLNEEVALKLVRPEIAADRETLERFHNELKLARKISHPNVGRMYELMEEKGTHFITMEYVPGQDLQGADPADGAAHGRESDRDRQGDLRGTGRGPQAGNCPSGPQAVEHHHRPGGKRPDHGLRDRPVAGGEEPDRGRGDDRDAGVHDPGAGRGQGGRTRARTSIRWGSSSTRC